MKTRYKLMLLLPLIYVTSCGYGLKDAVYGNKYNSPVFTENFYQYIDEDIKSAKDCGSTMLDDTNLVFENFGDANFVDRVDPNRARTLQYQNWSNLEGQYYGRQNNLSLKEETFKYGYVSKLFDGRMFCGGLFQLSRVQIDETGFGVTFKKELSSKVDGTVPYFAMNFKASVDYTNPHDKDGNPVYPETTVKEHYSSIKLNVSFYLKKTNENELEKYMYSYIFGQDGVEDSGLETNWHDYIIETNNIYDTKSNYKFYGFSLEGLHYERCVGISIDYEVLKDEYYLREEAPRPYSLMIYEIFISNVNWN